MGVSLGTVRVCICVCPCWLGLQGLGRLGFGSCPYLIVLRLSGFLSDPSCTVSCAVPCYAAGCLGDQMAALLGQRAAPGEAKNTYGTGCFMLLNTGSVCGPCLCNGWLTVLHCRSTAPAVFATALSPFQPAHTVPASVPQLVSHLACPMW